MTHTRWIGMALVTGLLLLWSAPSLSQDAASGLVKKAVKLYKKKKYGEARLLLEAALKDDPGYAKIHMHMAQTLCQLRAKEKICEHGALRSTIMRHLFKARLSRRQKSRLHRNKALAPIRDTFAYQRLRGLSPRKTKNVITILRNVSWYGPLIGKGPASGIDFKKKGQMTFWMMTDGAKQTFKGTWSSRSNLVFIKLEKAIDGIKELQGALQITGELVLPGLPGPFSDDPHDCVTKKDSAF